MKKWQIVKAEDIIDFNPKESINDQTQPV